MSANYFNKIARTNLTMKPCMLGRTGNAVLKTLNKQTKTEIPPEEDGNLKLRAENKGPVRLCKSHDRMTWLENLVGKKHRAPRSLLSYKRSKTGRLGLHNKYEPNSSKLLKAVMTLSDKSVKKLEALNKKVVDGGLMSNKSKTMRRHESSSSVLSKSSSRYLRRTRANINSKAYSTYGTNVINKEPPRNQHMSSSWAIKSNNMMNNASMKKNLMPVDHDVRNLISVSATPQSPRDLDPLHTWKHPPHPNDYKMDLTQIIDTVPNEKQVQYDRMRLLSQHSPWDNQRRTSKNFHVNLSRNQYITGDDPNAVLEHSIRRDLNAMANEQKKEQQQQQQRTEKDVSNLVNRHMERMGATRKACRTNATDSNRTVRSWPTNHHTIRPDLLNMTTVPTTSRFSHVATIQSMI